MSDPAPIIFSDCCAAMEEQARLARAYRWFAHAAAKDFRSQFSSMGAQVAAEAFVSRIASGIRDKSTQQVVVNAARAEFARQFGAH